MLTVFNRQPYIALLLFCFAQFSVATPVNQPEMTTNELIQDLKSGGHIIYMRHAKTEHSQKDQGVNRLDNCDKQRNLSDLGREQAKRIGKKLASLNVPVASVLSSPYCRCKDTALLAFGKMRVEKDLQFSISKSPKESKDLGERLKNLMLEADTKEGNAVFVGHTSNLKDGLGIWPKPEGVLVVLKNVNGKIVFKGMIKPEELSEQ